MLVLSRKQDQEILIGDNIKITVLKARGNTVRLGIEAPRDVKVVRGELDSRTNSQPAPAEVAVTSESNANFTVVFDDDAAVSDKQSLCEGEGGLTFDIVSYPNTADRQVDDPVQGRKINGRFADLNATKPAGRATETVQFQSKLPKVLEHNRLKEIVTRISNER